MIADTTFLIDILRNLSSATQKVHELDKRNEIILTTTVSVFEVWKGDDAEEKKSGRILEMLNSVGILAFDYASAIEAGNIYRKLSRKGIVIDPEDTMIAGITKMHSETLLTRNKKHFERIEGLNIEEY